MNGRERISSAVKILGVSTSEADYRAAINSAYYGLYHIGLDLQKELNLPKYKATQGSGSHDSLIEAFLECSNLSLDPALKRNAKSFGFMLKDLRNYRVKADYRHDLAINKQDAEYALALAERASNLAESATKLANEIKNS